VERGVLLHREHDLVDVDGDWDGLNESREVAVWCVRWNGCWSGVGGWLYSPDLWVCCLDYGGWGGKGKRLLCVLHFCVTWGIGAGVLGVSGVYGHIQGYDCTCVL
jgi:hypothetical protein